MQIWFCLFSFLVSCFSHIEMPLFISLYVSSASPFFVVLLVRALHLIKLIYINKNSITETKNCSIIFSGCDCIYRFVYLFLFLSPVQTKSTKLRDRFRFIWHIWRKLKIIEASSKIYRKKKTTTAKTMTPNKDEIQKRIESNSLNTVF